MLNREHAQSYQQACENFLRVANEILSQQLYRECTRLAIKKMAKRVRKDCQVPLQQRRWTDDDFARWQAEINMKMKLDVLFSLWQKVNAYYDILKRTHKHVRRVARWVNFLQKFPDNERSIQSLNKNLQEFEARYQKVTLNMRRWSKEVKKYITPDLYRQIEQWTVRLKQESKKAPKQRMSVRVLNRQFQRGVNQPLKRTLEPRWYDLNGWWSWWWDASIVPACQRFKLRFIHSN